MRVIIGGFIYPAGDFRETMRVMATRTDDRLVGRAHEREQLAASLAGSRTEPGRILVIEGEPGIGKSRLMLELARIAAEEGCAVLSARASEFERDLPYALFSEAMEQHLSELGERRLRLLGAADPDALAAVTALVRREPDGVQVADRHRTHRAFRDLFERLATPRPLVLCLDDVHWADPGSVDALAALVRRPPNARVLVGLAVREAQLPTPLARALAAAMVEGRAVRVVLSPLTKAEAEELVGTDVQTIFPLSGGNPFYLQQLARVPVLPAAIDGRSAAGQVPAVVAASLVNELAELSPPPRLMINAAAVLGDPFEPDLAAAVAELEEATALRALDDLLARTLVRAAQSPQRFAFRHPLVRHAVYEATAGGWRLGAHARAARTLAQRGAGAVEQSHHLVQSARVGDEDAIRLITEAAQTSHASAPATAARFYRAALGLMADGAASRAQQAGLQLALADAQEASGDPAGARETLLGALAGADGAERLALTVRVASAEQWLGRNEEAHRRLQVALGDLPAEPSPDRFRLSMMLGLTELFDCELEHARAQASDARCDALALGDRVAECSALALGAVAWVSDAGGIPAENEVRAAVSALERLTESQRATRLPALWMVGRSQRVLGEFGRAVDTLRRGSQLAGKTGRETQLLLLAVESVPALVELGLVAEALAAAEHGVELARLAGAPQLLWAQCALCFAQLTAGDAAAALRQAQEAAETETPPDFHARGQPGWCQGAALAASGDPERGAEAMLEAVGGLELTRVLPGERASAAADVVDVLLACERLDDACRALAAGEAAAASAGTDWPAMTARRARAAVLLAQGHAREAADAAAAVARAARDLAPLTAARAQLIQGKALAAARDRASATAVLTTAESAFDSFGAIRWRNDAVRTLRQLGHRVRRSAQPATSRALGPLTEREREIAGLVATGHTNREVAEQLVLSAKTIEAHLRNIYAKLGVRSRVELARRVEQDSGPQGRATPVR
jgi:DNA-binding NarL/FixJ family response regulator